MFTQPQEIAWRHIMVDIPRDPNVVYGGTIGIGKVSASSTEVRNQIQYLQPIAHKRESEEVQLLRKLVNMRAGGGPAGAPGGVRLEQSQHRIPA